MVEITGGSALSLSDILSLLYGATVASGSTDDGAGIRYDMIYDNSEVT